MWNLFWDESYKKIRDFYTNLGLKNQHLIKDCNDKRELPKSFWAEISSSGIYDNALTHGGIDGIVYIAAVVEGLCYGSLDGGIAISLCSHFGLGFSTIARHAQEGLRKKIINKIINDNAIIAFAVTELHGGSDATKLQTKIAKQGDHYILNGDKWCITNALFANIIITFAREIETNESVALVLERKWDGIEVTPLSPVGLKSSPIGQISFNNVKVPMENVLGNIGSGLTILNESFTRERLLAPFAAIGLMQRVLDDTFKYAHDRNVFGEKIASYQFIKYRLTEMKMSLNTTQSLGHVALKSYIMKENTMGIASAAKMYAANQALSAVEHAIKIFGSYGIQEGSVGDILTSVMASTIAGGTEEIHRESIYQELYLNYRHNLRKKMRLK